MCTVSAMEYWIVGATPEAFFSPHKSAPRYYDCRLGP